MKYGSSVYKEQSQKIGTSILGIIVILTMILSSCAPAELDPVDQQVPSALDETQSNTNPDTSPTATKTPSSVDIPYEQIKEPVAIALPE